MILRQLSPSAAVRALFVALLSAVVLLIPVAAASAHDQLTGSNPAANAAVAAPPKVIELTFSSNPIALGSEILVTDAAGKSWSEGSLVIVDNKVTQALAAGAPAGAYTVRWRVVSADSHPIEGTFGFTAAGTAAAEPSPVTSTAPTAPAAGTPAPLETPQAPDAAPQARSAVPWVVGGFAVAVVAIAAVLFFGARRRQGE